MLFQSTLPHGSDVVVLISYFAMLISIHAPSRERRRLLSYCCMHKGYFNPRSLTGATFCLLWACLRQPISIHAPSRERPFAPIVQMVFRDFNPRSLTGATEPFCAVGSCYTISIHAPSRERRRGCTMTILTVLISIHAPSRERHNIYGHLFDGLNFNPRSLTGATTDSAITAIRPRFQSTLPHGSDSSIRVLICLYLQFQSTLPHGSDVTSLTQSF